MEFHVFQCKSDRDYFIVTDAAHAESMTAVAFDEKLAINSINHQGFYRFEAKSLNPVAEAPAAMP